MKAIKIDPFTNSAENWSFIESHLDDYYVNELVSDSNKLAEIINNDCEPVFERELITIDDAKRLEYVINKVLYNRAIKDY